jgi:hypothetical protein
MIMNDEFLLQRAQAVRLIADRADPFARSACSTLPTGMREAPAALPVHRLVSGPIMFLL